MRPATVLLQRHGYHVDGATTAISALDHCASSKYDLIITEFAMPDMSGFELYRQIKRIDQGARVAFFVTFEVRPSELRRVFPGMESVHLIVKPVTIAELVRRIEEIFGGDGKLLGA